MKRIATSLLTAAALCVAVSAFAAPNPNSDLVKTYIYQDCPAPFSTLTLNNAYPGFIQFTDAHICPSANFENLHNWSFSSDGGVTETVFNNGDAYRFGFDFQISGPATPLGNGDGLAEGGLRSSPWWGQDTEGRINVKVTNDPGNGEIACFGGYMPFHSFTATEGLHYHLGDIIHLEVIIKPNSLSQLDPGTAEYIVRLNGTTYATGPLPFGPANPNDPPHGTYGPEDDGRAGGIFAPFVGGPAVPPATNPGNGPGSVTGTFFDVFFTTLPTAAHKSTWGQLKSLYR